MTTIEGLLRGFHLFRQLKFQWSEACEKSYRKLKKRLTTGPVFTLPEGTQGFVVYYDTYRFWFGCMLMQNEKEGYSLCL